jgi:hypothetical protein
MDISIFNQGMLSADEGGLTCLHQAIKAGSVQVRIMSPYRHFLKVFINSMI